MESLETVRQLLRARGHVSVAALLQGARVDLAASGQYTRQWQHVLDMAEVYAPIPDYLQLIGLPQWAKDEILQTIREVWPTRQHVVDIVDVQFRPESVDAKEAITSKEHLLEEANWLERCLADLATGRTQVSSTGLEYKRRLGSFEDALVRQEISNPIPSDDLPLWSARLRAGEFPTRQSWREYISRLFEPVKDQLRTETSLRDTSMRKGTTGWSLVRRQLRKTQSQLRGANHEEDFQVVGLLCRETIISTAQTVYHPDRHPSQDGTRTSTTDAKRMLDDYIAVELGGASNKAARKHARAALDLANSLQHQRTADYRTAALCASATESAARVIAIIAGARPFDRTEVPLDHGIIE